MLGSSLANAAGGEYDPVEARRWFEKALAQGVPDASSELAELT